MKRSLDLQQIMLRAWYEQRGWLAMLRPLSQLYSRYAQRQRYLADPSSSWQPPVPLIVVGNITLGGTGKTPMVIWLVEHLRSRGLRVGVISRGYGGKPPSFPWRVQPVQDDPAQVGDRAEGGHGRQAQDQQPEDPADAVEDGAPGVGMAVAGGAAEHRQAQFGDLGRGGGRG